MPMDSRSVRFFLLLGGLRKVFFPQKPQLPKCVCEWHCSVPRSAESVLSGLRGIMLLAGWDNHCAGGHKICFGNKIVSCSQGRRRQGDFSHQREEYGRL